MNEHRTALIPFHWYIIAAVSIFLYLLPTWVDRVLPPPVYDQYVVVDSPVQVGRTIAVTATRCNSTNELQAYTFLRAMQATDGTVLPLAAGQSIATPGCDKVVVGTASVPEHAAPGEYHLLMVLESQGVFRQVHVAYMSNKFTVIP